ncbi:MAG: flagellar hook-basal body complex protein [Kiritimatiellae bacterium]|nr:flagellar hook-basal body complex protein [Kiritimatiellia bacterium]
MMPSFDSGVSGLRVHQQRMNVIANNIANVNTVGYKQSDVTFREAMIDTIRAPAPRTPGLQIGLGAKFGGITRDFGSGMLMETGHPSNIAINGDGFFLVQNLAGEIFYTRAGDYVLDVADINTVNMITPDGYTLIGTDGLPINLEPGGGTLASFSIDQDGTITTVDTAGNTATPNTVRIVMFQNNNGLEAAGHNLYRWTAAASPAEPPAAGANLPEVGSILQGYLEMSNTDLAEEFSDMIITQRGFQANARTITTSDEMLLELMSLKR